MRVILQCRLHLGSAPWHRPSQQNHRHLSMATGRPPPHGVGGHWPPFSNGHTWRRSCCEDQRSVHCQGLHALLPGPAEEVFSNKLVIRIFPCVIIWIMCTDTWWHFGKLTKEKSLETCLIFISVNFSERKLIHVVLGEGTGQNLKKKKEKERGKNTYVASWTSLDCFLTGLKLTEKRLLWEDCHCWAVSAHLRNKFRTCLLFHWSR